MGKKTVYKIAVCDDEPKELRQMCEAVESYDSRYADYEFEICEFGNAIDMLHFLEKTGGCEIALLDICMPGISGMEIGEEIRRRGDCTEIIFLTNSREYAVDAYALNAAHYLVKPYAQESFDTAMNRAIECLVQKAMTKIPLYLENGTVRIVDASAISYIECVKYDRVVHIDTKEYKERQRSLGQLWEELERLLPGQFFSPYRGFLVNKEQIQKIQPHGIMMQNGSQIPIRRGDFRKIKDLFFEWAFGNASMNG